MAVAGRPSVTRLTHSSCSVGEGAGCAGQVGRRWKHARAGGALARASPTAHLHPPANRYPPPTCTGLRHSGMPSSAALKIATTSPGEGQRSAGGGRVGEVGRRPLAHGSARLGWRRRAAESRLVHLQAGPPSSAAPARQLTHAASAPPTPVFHSRNQPPLYFLGSPSPMLPAFPHRCCRSPAPPLTQIPTPPKVPAHRCWRTPCTG